MYCLLLASFFLRRYSYWMQDILTSVWHFIQAAAAPIARPLEEMWDNGLAGHEMKSIMVATACLLVAIIVRQPMAWLILTWLKNIAKKFPNDWLDQALVDALRGPIRAFPLWFGLAAANEALKLPPRQEAFADHLVLSFGAVLLFLAVYAALQPLSRHLMKLEGALTRPMIGWLRRGLRVLLIFIAVGSVLDIWGIQIGPILAGLGLLGAAVALGAQDLFKNIIAGALILSEKRFDIGDWVMVDSVVEGEVERIGFRSTSIRRADKSHVYVPNSKLSDNALVNTSRTTYQRIQWTIGVEYGVSQAWIDAVCSDIRAYISGNPDFVPMDKMHSFVGLDNFSPDKINLLLVCFTTKTRWSEFVEVKSALGAAVKEILERHSPAVAPKA